jgi:hypothetical protein
MADFPTKAALLTKTVVETLTLDAVTSQTVLMTDYVATGSGTNSSLQGFEHARAQVVEWFLDITAAEVDELTIAVQVSDDATTWYDLDEESLVLANGSGGVVDLAAEFTGRSIRLAVNVGSRQNKFMRLAAIATDAGTLNADIIVSARVAGINTIFTKSS